MAEAKELPTWVRTSIGVVLFAIAIWGIAWAAGQGDAVQATMVASHEKQFVVVESDVKQLDNRVDVIEKSHIALQKDNQSLLSGQQEMKDLQAKFIDIQMEQIKFNAETRAYITEKAKGD